MESGPNLVPDGHAPQTRVDDGTLDFDFLVEKPNDAAPNSIPVAPASADSGRAPPQCLSCDYNLTGLPVLGACPECGRAYDLGLRRTADDTLEVDFIATKPAHGKASRPPAAPDELAIELEPGPAIAIDARKAIDTDPAILDVETPPPPVPAKASATWVELNSLPTTLRSSEDALASADVGGEKAEKPTPLCLGCNYPLKGLPNQGSCPECGRYYDLLRLTTYGDEEPPPVWLELLNGRVFAGIAAAGLWFVGLVLSADLLASSPKNALGMTFLAPMWGAGVVVLCLVAIYGKRNPGVWIAVVVGAAIATLAALTAGLWHGAVPMAGAMCGGVWSMWRSSGFADDE